MGGLFIAVVMFFPNGLAGIWQEYGHYITDRFKPIKKIFIKLAPSMVQKKLGGEAN